MVIQKLKTHYQYPYVVTLGTLRFTPVNWGEIDAWCSRAFGQLGDKWQKHGSGWQFREETDAVQLVLTWS